MTTPTVQLDSQTILMLNNAFGSTSPTYNAVISGADRSPYFAGMLNSLAARPNTSIAFDNTPQNSRTGTSSTIDSSGHETLTIDQSKLVGTVNTGLQGDTFDEVIAHEIGHMLGPGGNTDPGTATNPGAAGAISNNDEGVAITNQYIVMEQLNPGSKIYCDQPSGIVTQNLQTDSAQYFPDVSQLTFGDAASRAFTAVGSQPVGYVGGYSGSLNPSGYNPSMSYNTLAADNWILERCDSGNVTSSSVDWSKVTNQFSYTQNANGTCSLNASAIPLINPQGAATGSASSSGVVSPAGQDNDVSTTVTINGQTSTTTVTTTGSGAIDVELSGQGAVYDGNNATIKVDAGASATIIGNSDQLSFSGGGSAVVQGSQMSQRSTATIL